MTTTDDRSPEQKRIDQLEGELAALRAQAEERQEWDENDSFQVTAPVIIAHMPGEGYRHLYMGAVLPKGLTPQTIEHHLNVSKQIAKIGSPEAATAFELARQEALGRGEEPMVVGAEGADREQAEREQAEYAKAQDAAGARKGDQPLTREQREVPQGMPPPAGPLVTEEARQMAEQRAARGRKAQEGGKAGQEKAAQDKPKG